MNKKILLRKFKSEFGKCNSHKADRLTAAITQMVIENDCECAAFIYDDKESYSARAIAMPPDSFAHQIAKAILAIYRKEGINPTDTINAIINYMELEVNHS